MLDTLLTVYLAQSGKQQDMHKVHLLKENSRILIPFIFHVQVEEAGFHVVQETPFHGASPDGLTMCATEGVLWK